MKVDDNEFYSISEYDTHNTTEDLIRDWDDPEVKKILKECEKRGNSNYYVTKWQESDGDTCEEILEQINLDEFLGRLDNGKS